MSDNISLIVAIDEAYGIGKKNQLLCHLPADLKYFKETTLHKPIVMGRKTYESIGRPLPNRENIILSRTLKNENGIIIIDSVEALFQLTANDPEVMVIGGSEIYQQFLPFANQLYLTRIHHLFEADAFFPEVDWTQWSVIKEHIHAKDEKNLYDLTFQVQKKVDKGLRMSRMHTTQKSEVN